MHLTVDLTYPASRDEVAAMLADERFVRWRSERTVGAGTPGGGTVAQADVTGSTRNGFTVVVRRTLDTDQIPAQARALVGNSLEIRQAEAWEAEADGQRLGTLSVEIIGAPVRISGTVRLASLPDGAGTSLTYDGDVRATVPLFGTVVEDAAARAVRTALEAEAEAGRAWLAGQTS